MRFSHYVVFCLLILPLCIGQRASSARPEEPALHLMVGQMLIVGFVGDSVEADGYQTVLQQAHEGKIGGVLYLHRNISGLQQVRQMNARLQCVSALPMLVAIDQEGGRVERLTAAVGFRGIPGAASVSTTMSPDMAKELYRDLGARLAYWGFNLNLGPVVDLDINPDNPIIGRLGRSYSEVPARVEAYARTFVDGHRSSGVLTSLKHFPGHGSSTGDTHLGAVDVTQTWKEQELLPYTALIASGHADMIMVSHVMNGHLSAGERVPASLSSTILIELLRKTMGFEGAVISDDLQMGAILDSRDFEETVRAAVLAGNDILVFSNYQSQDPLIPEKAAAILRDEAQRNPEMLERIRESYARIARLKSKL